MDNNSPNLNKKAVILDLVFGGYYAGLEEGAFHVFRLLDFGKDTYHAQLFQETFDKLPSYDEIKGLIPFIWHAPIDTANLFTKDSLALIGHEKLDHEALIGYEEYMKQTDDDDHGIKDVLQKLIEYSDQEPLKIKLGQSGGAVTVTPIE